MSRLKQWHLQYKNRGISCTKAGISKVLKQGHVKTKAGASTVLKPELYSVKTGACTNMKYSSNNSDK